MELIKIEDGTLAPEIASQMAEFKYIDEQRKAFKRQILEAMEEAGVIKLETDEMVISYIASTDRETFDSQTFRAENPNLYDEYITMTPVKPSIRIKLKEEQL